MISHSPQPEPVESALARIRDRVVARGDLPHTTIAEQLELLARLAEFPFGRFLLCNRGWDAYWTHYAVFDYPRRGRAAGVDEAGRPHTPLERCLLELPVCHATQERFVHFQAALQRCVKPGVRMASLPCGLMDDLLTLDFSGVSEVHLVGIDLDPEALRLAAENAQRHGLSARVSLRREDAWAPTGDRFDVLTSNGLNIYEPDDVRVLDLYRAFHHRLERGGTLVTSYLVPPVEQQTATLDPEALRLQRVLLGDILGARFNCHRTTEQTRDLLTRAGFEVVEVVRDKASYFPTVIARRPR